MDTLYQLTKQLIELIKDKKPEIEIESEFHYIYGSPEAGVIYNHPATFPKGHVHIPAFTAQSLLTLIPQLFEGVESKSTTITINTTELHKQLKRGWKYSCDVSTLDISLSLEAPKDHKPVDFSVWNFRLEETLSQSLLQKYFVDGLWLQSQEAVIEDLINNINTYLK
jgi:hypothetical protein